MSELIPQIIEICAMVITVFFVKWVNAKSAEIKSKQKNETEDKYIDMLNETISDCVIATTQTYVDNLKKQNAFDIEAQKVAFTMTYEAVTKLLTTEAEKYLKEAIGDLNLYITQKIEAEVGLNK